MAGRESRPQVGILMGSDNDWETMEPAATRLAAFEIAYEVAVMSAHRSPKAVAQYAQSARRRGLGVVIVGAGGAAHLGGVVASWTTLPVIGVPVAASLAGLDALLATVQMPAGVPVATVAVGAARNAGLLAVRILSVADPELARRMTAFQADLRRSAQAKGEALRARLGR